MFAFMLLALLACGGGDGPLEIAGTWTDTWGTTYQLDDDTFSLGFDEGDPSVFHVLSFDNRADFAIAENDAGNPFDPGAFSRFDWTVTGGTTYLCQTVYDAGSAEAAEASPAADAGDLDAGCNGFAWNQLEPVE